MSAWRPDKPFLICAISVLLLSAIVLGACAQPVPATPSATPTAPMPVPTEGTPPPEKVATEEKPPATGETSPPPVAIPTAPPSPPSEQPTALTVDISGFAFSPASITVAVGATVTWTNKDSAPHTVTSNSGIFDSSTLSRESTFSFTFNQVGTFSYYCKFHPYMTGTVTVGEGTALPGGTIPSATSGSQGSGSDGSDYNY